MKNIPLDAESDVGEGYMVIFDPSRYYFGPKYDFWKRMKFRNEQHFCFLCDAVTGFKN